MRRRGARATARSRSTTRPSTPARTIAASGYSSYADGYDLVTADGARRKFTLDELKAICSFPPDYVLTGTLSTQAWTRLGNSVPPLMMRAVAATVRDEILAKTAG